MSPPRRGPDSVMTSHIVDLELGQVRGFMTVADSGLPSCAQAWRLHEITPTPVMKP